MKRVAKRLREAAKGLEGLAKTAATDWDEFARKMEKYKTKTVLTGDSWRRLRNEKFASVDRIIRTSHLEMQRIGRGCGMQHFYCPWTGELKEHGKREEDGE